MTIRRLLAFAVLTLAVGCGGVTPNKFPDPIEVTGKVTLANGNPVKNAVLHLQPVGNGSQAHFQVGADGAFKGSVTPGEYTYYVAPPRGDSIPGVPDKFLQGSMDRKISIKTGDSTLNLKFE